MQPMSDFQKRIESLSPKRLMLLALELQSQVERMERRRVEPIAIVGIGCRLPGAQGGPNDFWRLLESGKSAVSEVPKERWDSADYYDPNIEAPGRMASKWGGFLSHVDQFDAPFFGIAGREAKSMDPQHRILLEVCWEALEQAGHSPRQLANTATGVFLGICASDYQTMLLARGEGAIDGYLASGTAPSIAAGRVSYTFGLQGPSISIDTACSASLVAIHLACQSLRTQECSMALAGGVNAILSPATTIALSKAHMLSSDGRCKTFDARADGFVRGEGCGMVVLKRLSDAESDGDHVWGVIRGTAVNQDGRSSGMTAPSGKAQEAVIRAALAQAGVSGEEIGYVEAHGTGTALGDPIEAHALAAVLGVGRGAENPLVVGSVKTNVGHLEAAAGIAGLIKAVLSLEHERIPAHLHFEQMNPHIDWGGVPVEIPVSGRAWPRGERRRLAGVSSFGFSGTNAHVIVEEAPQPPARAEGCERPLHVLALSARSETALGELGGRYAAVLEQSSGPVGDVCFTANAGRAHFEHRLAVTGSSSAELRSALLKALPGGRVQEREGIRPVFLFPGQGAQYAGMGRQLYETQPVFRAAMEQCAEGLSGELDRPLLEVLWGRETDLLAQTAYTQPGLFAVEYAVAALWRSWGIEPAVVLGHSVGEYVAACVAGVYSLGDGLKLIARRGRLMQAVGGQGAMAAVEASEIRVGEALRGLEERVTVAAINAPEQTVISGYEGELRIVEQRLMESGVRVHRLKVSHGFHSPQMREMEAAFAEVAQEIQFQAPRLRVISSVTGQAVSGKEMSQPAYWRCQVGAPVRFSRAMETLRESEATVFLEAGPGATLAALGQQSIDTEGTLWLASLRRNREEWPQLLDTLAQLYVHGADVNWTGFDKPYPRRRLSLPTYPFQRQSYWMQPATSSKTLHPIARHQMEEPPDQSPSNWYYEVAWQPVAAAGVATRVDRGTALRCVIVADSGNLASELGDHLRALGGQVTVVSSPEAARAAFRNGPHDCILHLASSTTDSSAGSSDSVSGVLKTAQALIAEDHGARLWIVTSGAQGPLAPRSVHNVEQAPLWGFGKTFALEHPSLWGGMVDLDPASRPSRSAVELLSAIENSHGEDQLAFRNGMRYVARLVRALAPSGRPPTFTAGKTYLITGGLGGLGLRVAKWMAHHGARNLVLLGRKAPSEQARKVIADLQGGDVHVEVYAADVASLPEIEDVFRKMGEALPALGGIVHAAGILDDGIIAQQTSERFKQVMLPKVEGARNLHRLTAEMRLDFFVLFSSAASLIGSAGQASYAAANAYLDALALYRRSKGMTALSINWGGWADSGMAARVGAQNQRRTEFQLMPPPLALAALGQVLSLGTAQIGIVAIDWDVQKLRHGRQLFFQDVLAETKPVRATGEEIQSSENRPLDQLLRMSGAERQNWLIGYLIEAIAPILGVGVSIIEPSRPVTDFGLDSLMALEFRNRVNSDFRVQIPAVKLLRGLTLVDVARLIETELPLRNSHAPDAAVLHQNAEFPLSFGQQQGWFGHKFTAEFSPNNIGLTVRAVPRLDLPAFERALGRLMARHAALRTVFFETEMGVPMQRVLSAPQPDVLVIDATALTDEEIKERMNRDFREPLALDKPMFSATVFRGAEEDVLFFKLDHINLDHWSIGICIEDLEKFYTSELMGTEPNLEPIKAEYREYVEWESKFAQGPEAEKHWNYWKQKLGGELPVLKLQSSRERPAILVSRGKALPVSFAPAHLSELQRISREYRATTYTILLSIFEVLLYRYTRQTDIVVGTSVAGREDPRWANTVGFFINVLGLRCDLSGNPKFGEYLVRSRDTVWEALEHQAFPFSLFLMKIRQRRGLERIPIFQSFFNFLTDRAGSLRTLFMGMENRPLNFGHSKLYPFMIMPQQEGRLEISMQLVEVEGVIRGYLNYNSNVVDHQIAEAMVTDYPRLLDAIIHAPDTPIDDLLPGPSIETPNREEILL
jgi:acyl transferase domain-containing protein/acyl carrier protein